MAEMIEWSGEFRTAVAARKVSIRAHLRAGPWSDTPERQDGRPIDIVVMNLPDAIKLREVLDMWIKEEEL